MAVVLAPLLLLLSVTPTAGGSSAWKALGPFEPGAVFRLIPDPVRAERLYATTGNTYSTIFRSDDGGQSWTERPVPAVDGRMPDIIDLAVDPVAEGTLYAATSSGMFKSIDFGNAWRLVTAAVSGRIAADPTRPGLVYVARGTVFRSEDSGETWTPLSVGNASLVSVDPATGAVFLGTRSVGILKSEDRGATWTPSNDGIQGLTIVDFSVGGGSQSTLWVATSTARPYPQLDLPGGFFRSSDGGRHWTSVGGTLPPTPYGRVEADPRSALVAYAGPPGSTFRTLDGGGTWTELTRPLTTVSAGIVIAVSPASGTTYAVVTESIRSKLFRSEDRGDTWTPLSDVGIPVQVAALAIAPAAPDVLAVGSHNGAGIFRSTNSGASWTAPTLVSDSLILYALAFDAAKPSTLYAGTSRGVYKSTDTGLTWQSASRGMPEQNFVLALAVSPDDPATIYAGTTNGLFQTSNAGADWNESDDGIALRPNGTVGFVLALAVSPKSPGELFASTELGLFKSVDRARTWFAAGAGINGQEVFPILLGLAVDPHDPRRVFAAGGSVWKSADGGQTWSKTVVPASTVAVNAVTGYAYAGGYGNVYESPDGGESWQLLGGVLTTPSGAVLSVVRLAFGGRGGLSVYAGTDVGGVFRYTPPITPGTSPRRPAPLPFR